MKDYRRALALNFQLVAEAQAHYRRYGFPDLPVPWVIGREAYEETRPAEALPYKTLGGFLVGSAEQSFLHLMLEGQTITRAQATTPCFRDEAHDEIHSPYFLKTELIDAVEVNATGLERVISAAEDFFTQYLPVARLAIGDGTWDLTCAQTGLELGSYGLRHHGSLSWVYGTGLALPRLSQALMQVSQD